MRAREVVSLAGSLQPLTDYFNAGRQLPRLVILVSPT